MKFVRKRDGRLENFDQERITNAIWKAAKAVGGKDRELAKRLSDQVVVELKKRFGEEGVPTVEEIQDVVEKTLIENGHARTAKAYILYRKQHQDLRELAAILSSADLVDQYLEIEDWRVRENSNMSYSLQGLNNYLSSTVIAKYWITRIYPPKIADAHFSGDMHIHDLGVLGPYCVGWDVKDLLLFGFGGVQGKIESKPAKHFRTALGQVVNFFYTLQGEAAGAQAFSNFDTYLAPFIRYDGLNQKEVEQALQEFFFNMNVPTRVGFQTPFTNLTLDLVVPDFMKDEPVIIGGEVMDKTYGDMHAEMEIFNLAFAEVMNKGDAKGRVFTFPIPTYNITKDFDWESPITQRIFEVTAKYGVPYFSNFINSDMKPEDVRSMCCRLRIDNRELRKRGGGFFGANPLTGSIGVVTLNIPRIGYLAKDEDEFFERLETLMETAKDSLEIKRKALENFTEAGLYPYSRRYLRNVKETFGKYWKNHFSTIGLVGLNEAI
ncbi:MAG: ribonucleoside triphosphate reductase, partial [Candidatus Bathyarchaeia archaeon]